jgi:hypothetical protein
MPIIYYFIILLLYIREVLPPQIAINSKQLGIQLWYSQFLDRPTEVPAIFTAQRLNHWRAWAVRVQRLSMVHGYVAHQGV